MSFKSENNDCIGEIMSTPGKELSNSGEESCFCGEHVINLRTRTVKLQKRGADSSIE